MLPPSLLFHLIGQMFQSFHQLLFLIKMGRLFNSTLNDECLLCNAFHNFNLVIIKSSNANMDSMG